MKDLIERLRKGIVTSAPYEPQYTVPPVKICLEAADEIENLLAEEKMQLEQIVNQGLEIARLTSHDQFLADANKQWMADCERLTAELTTSRYWREQEVKDLTAELARAKQYHANELADVTAELAEMKAERNSLSVAAAHWNHRYIDACQQHADRQTNLGHEIVALEDERDAYRSWGSQNEASFSAECNALKSALLGAQALIAELQSERVALTDNLARAKEYHAGELADVVAERDSLQAQLTNIWI